MATKTAPQKTRYQMLQEAKERRRHEYAEDVKRSKDRTKKIKMLTPLTGKKRATPEGGTVTLPAFEADRFIENGMAEEVN